MKSCKLKPEGWTSIDRNLPGGENRRSAHGCAQPWSDQSRPQLGHPAGRGSLTLVFYRLVLTASVFLALILVVPLQPAARAFGEPAASIVDSPNRGALSGSTTGLSAATTNVGKWDRHEIQFTNNSWSGNPFDLEFSGTFTHTSTGRTLKQLGFYAGNNTWKIFFMPDRVGEWTYRTESTDPDLDGKTGSFNCVSSNLPGALRPSGNRWRLSDSGQYVSPIMLPVREWFKRSETPNGVDDFIKWADDVAGATIVGTTLVFFHHDQAEMPFVEGQEGVEFNIPMWDRLNDHYDYLRDRGMGHYIMLYSDDSESPSRNGIEAQSEEELRLFRYVVARFSAYPMVIWDTGIDIGEYRSNSWIDWHTAWFKEYDPWIHPVSSRTGGGSRGKFPAGATYYSDGVSTLPGHSTLINIFKTRSVPTAFTDRWREDYSRGNFDRTAIRQAAWETGLLGMGAYVSGNENGGYLTENYASDFKAAPDLGIRRDFFDGHLVGLEKLTPAASLIVSGSGVLLVADPGDRYIAYDRDGGSFTIDLSGTSATLLASWFNPRTGGSTAIDPVSGGGSRTFRTPDNNDWVLHLVRSSAPVPPSATATHQPTASMTPTNTASPIRTATSTPTPRPSITASPSRTASSTPTSRPSNTAVQSQTPTATPSVTFTASPSATGPSSTPSPSATLGVLASPGPGTPTLTPDAEQPGGQGSTSLAATSTLASTAAAMMETAVVGTATALAETPLTEPDPLSDGRPLRELSLFDQLVEFARSWLGVPSLILLGGIEFGLLALLLRALLR